MGKGKRHQRAPETPPPPCCEAQGCSDFPFFGLHLAGAIRRVWVCDRHRRMNHLDELRTRSQEAIIRHAAELFTREESELDRYELMLGLPPHDRVTFFIRQNGERERAELGPVLR